MIMGTGNLTELTDVDSAGVNTILIGFCQELSIRSVLTTAVINWARSSVREIDVARRLAHYAVANRALPKNVEPRLRRRLRDPRVARIRRRQSGRASAANSRPQLAHLCRGWKDRGDEQGALAKRYRSFRSLRADGRHRLRPMRSTSGYEMMKAKTALTLSKNYRQDRAMDWGFLTEPEQSHLDRNVSEPSRSARTPSRLTAVEDLEEKGEGPA